jgi:hypothetical protein
MKEAEMGKACSMYERDKKCMQDINQKTWNEEPTCENKA